MHYSIVDSELYYSRGQQQTKHHKPESDTHKNNNIKKNQVPTPELARLLPNVRGFQEYIV